jgi:hypothetical protein
MRSDNVTTSMARLRWSQERKVESALHRARYAAAEGLHRELRRLHDKLLNETLFTLSCMRGKL